MGEIGGSSFLSRLRERERERERLESRAAPPRPIARSDDWRCFLGFSISVSLCRRSRSHSSVFVRLELTVILEMDACQRRFAGLEKTYLNNVVGCETDMKRSDWEVPHPPACPMGIICPAPRRVAKSPLTVENLNRLCYRPKSDLAASEDPSAEILSIMLTKNNPEDDLDAGYKQRGFFFGSPPMRANNPLIHDTQFVQESLALASPLGPSHGGKAASTRVDRPTPCSASSAFGSKPTVRIEGFACRSSKSQCVVSALA